MIVDMVSDLHGFFPQLDGGDLLIVAGDLTAMDRHEEYVSFLLWLKDQNYKKKVFISGNHDSQSLTQFAWHGADYLLDSGTEFEYWEDGKSPIDRASFKRTIKIWGSPWTPTFCNWHFMLDRGAPIRAKWDLIPDDTDILVTHGPPFGVLDGTRRERAGCVDLLKAMERVRPKLHVFGHIHEQGGQQILYKHQGPNTICVNASIMDECYDPVHKPMRVML